jgi:Xaa-Pro aminopeptidase
LQLGISEAEFQSRRERLLDVVSSRNQTGVVVFDHDYVLYFTGFFYLSTERPVVFVMNTEGETAIFVPQFEVEHAKLVARFDRVESYVEYPFETHPMEVLGSLLKDMGVTKAIAADGDGYPGILGYRGPSLSEVSGATVGLVDNVIEGMIAIKSEAEVALIQESCKWCNLGHRLLQRYSLPGVTETEASLRASTEATLAMYDTLGTLYRGQMASSDGPRVGYRGQIGRYSALAHAVANNIVFQKGDVLVSETSAPVWGYNSELERTMIIGRPADKQKRYFDHMAEVQQVAFRAIRPGRTCADVDREVLAYFENNDLTAYWGQHTGHAIGLRNHEAPFLDIGDRTEIKPGMVFTVEPGVYVPGFAGFRHSDTVLVTEDGIDILTYYPRDLERLMIGEG